MIPRRGQTPLKNGPPSLEASNQSQIDDLVQRNRTLEHTVKKLSSQLALEASRSKDAILDMQKQWQQEKVEWREGCDVLQACHHIVRLRNNVELEKERMGVIKELDLTRTEKLKVLQRDFRIAMFQAKEFELECRISELKEEQETDLAKFRSKLRSLESLCEEHISQLEAKNHELSVSEQEKHDTENKLAGLREKHAHLQVSTESFSSKFERTTLQLEGAQTRISDLERLNDELKRTNSDLQRQLEKWQNLENKGDAEVEQLRKRRIELEIQVKELQERLEKTVEDDASSLEKARRKIGKLRGALEHSQSEVTNLQTDAEDSSKQLDEALGLIDRLQAELEYERARLHHPTPQKLSSRTSLNSEGSESEVAANIGPVHDAPPKKNFGGLKSKPKSSRARLPNQDQEASEADNDAGPSSKKARGDYTLKRKTKRTAKADSDIGEIPQNPKSRSMPRNTTPSEDNVVETVAIKRSKGKAKDNNPIDGDMRSVEPEESLPRSKNKRKAPADPEISEVEIMGTRPGKGKGASRKPPSEARDSAPKRTKQSGLGRTGSVRSGAATREDEEAPPEVGKEAPKKKKRKINVFPPSGEGTGFNFMPQGDIGLNIPTMLSPVKETDRIPSRSASGSVIGSIGSMLINSFSRRGA